MQRTGESGLEHPKHVFELHDHLFHQQTELGLILLGIFTGQTLTCTTDGESPDRTADHGSDG